MDWLETVCGLPWTAHFHEAFISTTHRIPLKCCLIPPPPCLNLPLPFSSWLVGYKWKAKMCVRIVRSSSTALNSLLLLLLLLRVVMAAAAAACMLKVQSKLRSIA